MGELVVLARLPFADRLWVTHSSKVMHRVARGTGFTRCGIFVFWSYGCRAERPKQVCERCAARAAAMEAACEAKS